MATAAASAAASAATREAGPAPNAVLAFGAGVLAPNAATAEDDPSSSSSSSSSKAKGGAAPSAESSSEAEGGAAPDAESSSSEAKGPASGGPDAGPEGPKKTMLPIALEYLRSDVVYFQHISEEQAERHEAEWYRKPLVVQRLLMEKRSYLWTVRQRQLDWKPSRGEAINILDLFAGGLG